MEDEEIANQQIPDQNLQKKHQLMLERLSTRHQTRLETRKSDSPESSSTAAFLNSFNDLKKSITSQIESAAGPSRLPDISSISDLAKLVAESSYALPSYEVRSSLKTISGLKHNLENLSAKLVPKKKFSLKKKNLLRKKTTAPVRDSPGFRDKENQVLVKNFNDVR